MFRVTIICVCLLIVATDLASSRYFISLPDGLTLHNASSTWEEAQSQCANEGGVVASPINGQVFRTMMPLINMKNATFYIDVNSTESNGNFMSAEGILPENMTAAMINMSVLFDPLKGDCVAMNSHGLHVVPCSMRLPYMCIESSGIGNASIADDKTCNPDDLEYKYNHVTGKHYKLHREKLRWNDAKKTCAAECGHLVVIENSTEASAITKLYDFRDDYWIFIGLSQDKGDWKSVDGKPLNELYNVWLYGSTPTNDVTQCGTLYQTGHLDDMYCNSYCPFICQLNTNTN